MPSLDPILLAIAEGGRSLFPAEGGRSREGGLGLPQASLAVSGAGPGEPMRGDSDPRFDLLQVPCCSILYMWRYALAGVLSLSSRFSSVADLAIGSFVDMGLPGLPTLPRLPAPPAQLILVALTRLSLFCGGRGLRFLGDERSAPSQPRG